MKQFKQLIEPCLPDGGVPIVEIAKLAYADYVADILPRKLYISSLGDAIFQFYDALNTEFTFIIEPNFNLKDDDLLTDSIVIANQLQIFQKLHEWGFVQLPFNMPSDEEIKAYLDTDYTLKFNDIKEAFEYFIKKEGE
jgi:hypothetical protein